MGSCNILKVLIVCKSYHHGNTREVAESIGEVLDAEVVEPSEEHTSSVSDYDMVGFGSGIYKAEYHEDIFDFVEDLPKVKGKKAFIFSTSGFGKIPIIHGFGGKIKDELSKKGFEVVGEFSCRGYSTEGPFKLFGGVHEGRPDEEDLREAREFAEGILEETDDVNR